MGFAQSPTINNDPVSRLPLRMRGGFDRAGEIDPGNHWEATNNRRLAGERESVFVIYRRPFDADGDVTVHQICFVEIAEANLLPAIALFDYNCLECRHVFPSILAR